MKLALVWFASAAAAAHYPLNLASAATLLEVSLPTAKPSLRAAYRAKASVCHPDAGVTDAAQFLRVTAAYELLMQLRIRPVPLHHCCVLSLTYRY